MGFSMHLATQIMTHKCATLVVLESGAILACAAGGIRGNSQLDS